MERALVIGARGFIGGNVTRFLRSSGIAVDEALRGTPLDSLTGGSYDAVFFCAGNSKTFVSEREPIICLTENVIALHAYLTSLRYGVWVHVSSSAVYPQSAPVKVETMPLAVHELSMYGAHKLLSERYVTRFAPKWVIVRPTSFFGPGLKKNLLFDVRAGRRDVYLTRDSVLDYIPIERFAAVLATLAREAGNEIVNVGSGQSLTVDEILSMRPAEYVYHDERFHSDEGMSFERLRRHCPDSMTRDELRDAVRAFVLSSAEQEPSSQPSPFIGC